MTTGENVHAERLISALFQVDRATTQDDLGHARAALGRAVREIHGVGVPLARVSRMTGLPTAELEQLLD